MQVRLNIATKPLESHRRFLAGAGLLAVLGGIIFLALGWHVYSTRRAQEALRRKEQENNNRAALLQRRRKELDDFFARTENARLKERATFVNGIIDERSFDWTQMFMDLEKILPAGVRVVSILHKLRERSLLLRDEFAPKATDHRGVRCKTHDPGFLLCNFRSGVRNTLEIRRLLRQQSAELVL